MIIYAENLDIYWLNVIVYHLYYSYLVNIQKLINGWYYTTCFYNEILSNSDDSLFPNELKKPFFALFSLPMNRTGTGMLLQNIFKKVIRIRKYAQSSQQIPFFIKYITRRYDTNPSLCWALNRWGFFFLISFFRSIKTLLPVNCSTQALSHTITHANSLAQLSSLFLLRPLDLVLEIIFNNRFW